VTPDQILHAMRRSYADGRSLTLDPSHLAVLLAHVDHLRRAIDAADAEIARLRQR
jgi:hypothetical protein